MTRTVNWTARARKDLKRLDRKLQERILSAVDEFAANGRGDVRRLQGTRERIYRLARNGVRALRTSRFEKNGDVSLCPLPVFPSKTHLLLF